MTDHGAIASTKSALESASSLLPSVTPAATGTVAPSQQNVVDRTEEDFAAASARAAARPAQVDVAPAIAHADNTKIDNHPSYISAETFVQTLIGCLAGTRLPAGQPIPTFSDIEEAVEHLPPSNLKSTLLSSLITANGGIDAFRKTVATWFDDSMERLSGAYKRNLKTISLVIGLLVTIVFNADTIGVAGALWQDPDLRARVVAEATNVVKDPNNAVCNAEQAPQPGTTPLEKLQKGIAATEDCLRPFPIGWTSEKVANWSPLNILGWIMTGLALSLGAPFWFDLLSKFVNIRGAGPKPQRSDSK